MTDDIENTVYSKTVDYMRKDSFFYKNQPMQGIGLIPVDRSEENKKGNAAGAMAMLFDEIDLYAGKNTTNHYYTYGWSGLMSSSVRYKESAHFFAALEEEMKKFHQHNIYPKLRIFGYSHGGNVCLNLERARQKEFPNSNLKVNELILIGTPIQGETDFLVNGSVFEKAYHFYSDCDRIQQLDFFSFDRFFSERYFKEYSNFTPSHKVTQIQLKVTRNTPSTRRNKKKYTLAKNFNNAGIITGNSHLVRDASPGHSELWFFGWTPVNYRKEFPLNPFPCAAFAPYIIYELEKIKDQLPSPQPIVVDLRPEHETMLIKKQGSIELFTVAPLIPQAKLDTWKLQLTPYIPDLYTPKEYNQHIRLAYEHASLDYAKENINGNPQALKNQNKVQRLNNQKKLQLKQKRLVRKKTKLFHESLHVQMHCPFCEHTATTAHA